MQLLAGGAVLFSTLTLERFSVHCRAPSVPTMASATPSPTVGAGGAEAHPLDGAASQFIMVGGVELTTERLNDMQLLAGGAMLFSTLTLERFQTLFKAAPPRAYPFVAQNVLQMNGEHIDLEIVSVADLCMFNVKAKLAAKLDSAELLLKIVNQDGAGAVFDETGEIDLEAVAEDEFFNPGAEYWVLDGKSKPFEPKDKEWQHFDDSKIGDGVGGDLILSARDQKALDKRRVRAREFARSLTVASAPMENFVHHLLHGTVPTESAPSHWMSLLLHGTRPHWMTLLGLVFDLARDPALFSYEIETRVREPGGVYRDDKYTIVSDILFFFSPTSSNPLLSSTSATWGIHRRTLIHLLLKPAWRLPHLLPSLNNFDNLFELAEADDNLWVALSKIFDPACGIARQIEGRTLNDSYPAGNLVTELCEVLRQKCLRPRDFSFSGPQSGGKAGGEYQFPLRWIVEDTRVEYGTLTGEGCTEERYSGGPRLPPLQIIEETISDCERYEPETAELEPDQPQDRNVVKQSHRAFLAELKAVRSSLIGAIEARRPAT